MASRRALKKSINNLTFDLISECYIYKHFHQGKKEKQVEEVLENIAQKRNALIQKINNPTSKDDYKRNKKFYTGVVDDMRDMLTSMDKLAGK